MPTIDRPIILLGFHRSGTTLLGNIFRQHPDVAYWSEPRHVWMRNFAYRPYDILTARDASPKVVDQIRRDFAEFLREQGKQRFVEKTPSNCVRLPFIRETFPDCKVVHIIRDGRASTFSTLMALKTKPKPNLVRQRIRQTPIHQWPAYIPKFWRMMIAPRLRGGEIPFWGPRLPELRQWLRTMTKEEACAKQWQETLRIARRDSALLSPDQYQEWRYERLVTEPVDVAREMFEFTELSWPDGLEDWLRTKIHTRSLTKWRDNLTQEQVDRILPHLEPLLSELGYEPEHARAV